jgi:hypothetical protein
VLQKWQPQISQLSDIDRYLEEGLIIVHKVVINQKDLLFLTQRNTRVIFTSRTMD